MIEKYPFGATGHLSSRILFGAAALGGMKQERADATLSMLADYGINHIDTAASYGDSELRLADFLQDHRGQFFLASKTGERTRDGALRSIENSLERMKVDHVDLIQFHNLAQDDQWETAMGPGGALEAALEARDQGMVRFIGVTGHGTRIAEMHLRSLQAFDFASVLLPYSYASLQDERYAKEFETLYQLCKERQVAMQTIKSIARRRWREDDDSKRFSWYEPIRDEAAIHRAVHWVFKREGLFLNSSSDATLLKVILEAADAFDPELVDGLDEKVAKDFKAHDIEPLFERGKTDDVRV